MPCCAVSRRVMPPCDPSIPPCASACPAKGACSGLSCWGRGLLRDVRRASSCCSGMGGWVVGQLSGWAVKQLGGGRDTWSAFCLHGHEYGDMDAQNWNSDHNTAVSISLDHGQCWQQAGTHLGCKVDRTSIGCTHTKKEPHTKPLRVSHLGTVSPGTAHAAASGLPSAPRASGSSLTRLYKVAPTRIRNLRDGGCGSTGQK